MGYSRRTVLQPAFDLRGPAAGALSALFGAATSASLLGSAPTSTSLLGSAAIRSTPLKARSYSRAASETQADGLGWDNNAPLALSSGCSETQHRRCVAIPAQAIGLGLGRP